MSEPSRNDYRQHLELETPEHVVLDYEIAGVGSRVLAALADWTLIFLTILLISIAFGIFQRKSAWMAVVAIAVDFSLIWGYFTLFEGFWEGQTPGKRWLGIRVIRDSGHGISLSDAAARNLLLPVDIGFGMIGVILIAAHSKGRRIGDLVAGTVVVRDRPMEVGVAPSVAAPSTEVVVESGTPELTDEEFQLLREYTQRAPTLPAPVREAFARRFARQFATRFPDRVADDAGFLAQIYTAELAARRGRFGARSTSTGPGAGRSVSERLVARKAPRWREFQAMSERVTRGGLDVLVASELPDFAARYREVAADLARARTYHADAVTVGQLERLVASGHNALYRTERRTWQLIWDFLSYECPAAIVASWRYVLLAFLCFILPALGGYALLRDRPELAPELLPDVMLERAEAGAARTQAGKGYVLEPGDVRPLMAASIITNNIQVAFQAFASGALLGVGSLLALAFNGLSIGSAAGEFANVGMLGYLGTFIIGHGFLELFAIWVAGAAGFMLGRAMIAPGERSRKDALVIAGHTAIRMIGAVIIFLLIAGTIEGFISSSAWSVRARSMVSGASVIFLVLYLANGARRRSNIPFQT